MRRPDTAVARVLTSVTAGALCAGAKVLAPRRMTVRLDGLGWSIEDEIGKLLNTPVRASVFLGPPRANRKPVLQMYDGSGELVAVVKVGINELTAGLAHAEADALRLLANAQWSDVVVPRLLAEHEWNGLTMIVQSPLRTWQRSGGGNDARRTAAFGEIARSQGISRESLRSSSYLRGLTSRVARLNDERLRSSSLACLRSFADGPDRQIEMGSWHGDLTRWNMALADEGVLVWDWERFEKDVPVGFDTLHHEFLPSLKQSGGSLDRVGTRLVGRASRLISPLGMNLECAGVVAVLYLIELATRFTSDGQAATGVLGGDARTWLLPALDLIATDPGGNL